MVLWAVFVWPRQTYNSIFNHISFLLHGATWDVFTHAPKHRPTSRCAVIGQDADPGSARTFFLLTKRLTPTNTSRGLDSSFIQTSRQS